MPTSQPTPADAEQSHRERRWARYPADGALIDVKVGAEKFQAVAVDESIGGLGIETHDSVAQQRAFLSFDSVSVVCRAEASGTEQQRSISLWNGKRFVVAADQLAFRTRQARSVELQTMGEGREVIAGMYGLESHGDPQEVAERILEFEFGQA